MKLYLEKSTISLKGGCPECRRNIFIGAPNHQIIAGAQGLEVTPDIACVCGAILRVRRGKVRVLAHKEIPIRHKSAVPKVDLGERKAITIESKRPRVVPKVLRVE